MMKKTKLIYKPIPEYPDYYACSNGKIYSARRVKTNKDRICGRELTVFISPGSRFLSVNLVKDKNKTSFNVHKLVGWAFTGNSPCEYKFTHKRKNYFDNRPENIECSPIEQGLENENRIKEFELKDNEALFRRNINYDYRCKIWKEYEILKLKNNVRLLNNFLKIFLKVKKVI